jgi:hypothetical protein
MYFITKGTTCVHYIGTIICLHNLHYLKSDFDDINKNIYNKNFIGEIKGNLKSYDWGRKEFYFLGNL